MQFFMFNEALLNDVCSKPDQVKTLEPVGIPVDIMVVGFKKMSKDFPTMDDMEGHNVFIVRDYDVTVDDGKIYQVEKGSKGKNTHLIVLPNSSVAELKSTNGKHSCFVVVDNSNLRLSAKAELLRDALEVKKELSPKEKLAQLWLQNGRVGVSSQTMCEAVFPNLKVNTSSRDVPYDNGDFMRCQNFIKEIGGLSQEEWGKVAKINKKWKKLVENWDEIAKNVDSPNEAQRKMAYDKIKECINFPKMKP